MLLLLMSVLLFKLMLMLLKLMTTYIVQESHTQLGSAIPLPLIIYLTKQLPNLLIAQVLYYLIAITLAN